MHSELRDRKTKKILYEAARSYRMLVIRKVTKQETVLSIIAEPIRKKIKQLGIRRKDVSRAIKRARRSEEAKSS